MRKLWSRLSITKKVFLLTALVFSLFLALLLVCQLFFFEQYYAYTIRRSLTQTVRNFAEAYIYLSDDQAINEAIVRYANSDNAYITVLGENNALLHTVSYEMSVKTDTQTYRLILDNAIRDQSFLDMDLQEGDPVTVTFSYTPQGRQGRMMIPQTITAGEKTWRMPEFLPPMHAGEDNRPEESGGAPAAVSVSVDGIISAITLPTQQSAGANVQRNEAFGAAMHWMYQVNHGLQIAQDSPMHYVYQSPESGNTYMVVAEKILNQNDYEIIFALTPMQSVSEATAVNRDFVWIWLIFMVCMAVLTAIFFSRTVTRPIIRITDVTRQMSNLDFSQTCQVSTEDEIGRLAENVNRMSQKLDSAINELVDANAKLTEDIERERLLELQRKEFVATVSHELKTPLAIIRAYSEGLIDGVSVEKQGRYLNVIVDETAKMDSLILAMLENSKLETGAQKPDLKTYDLCAFTAKITKRMRQAFTAEGLALVDNISAQPVEKDFDKVLLEQVVANFLTNALHHTKPGGQVTVTVNSREVSVENEGAPIPAEDLDKVWDRFYKIDKSRARGHNTGSGLGLTIAKNILLLHKAVYGVVNTDTGVKFWFSLPDQDA